MRNLFLLTLALGALTTFAEPTISNVRLRQCWPWSANVIVTFTLSGAETEQMVKLAFTSEGRTVDVPSAALTGAQLGLGNGDHRLVWDPLQCDAAKKGLLPDVEVTVTPVEMPLYKIVDLSVTRGAVEYLTESQIRSGAYGTWEETTVGSSTTVIWTGVTNDIYKTQKMAFRYVPATTSAIWQAAKGRDTFFMGADASLSGDSPAYHVARAQPRGEVKLTSGYWLGVFEVTQQHWQYLKGGSDSYFTADNAMRPVESRASQGPTGMITVRGRSYDGYNWPVNGHKVDPNSFMGRFITKTGVAGADLPTESQWDYALRAGIDDGTTVRYGTTAEIARFGCSSSLARDTPAAEGGTAIVGSYAPNAWGIYDMLGNVTELVLAGWGSSLGETYYKAADFGTDPVGAAYGDHYFVSRGGSWLDDESKITFFFRMGDSFYGDKFTGFRVCLPGDAQ